MIEYLGMNNLPKIKEAMQENFRTKRMTEEEKYTWIAEEYGDNWEQMSPELLDSLNGTAGFKHCILMNYQWRSRMFAELNKVTLNHGVMTSEKLSQ